MILLTTILSPAFSAALSFLLPAIGAAGAVLVTDAQKYINTPLWNTNKFLKSNALPFGVTVTMAFIIYFIIVYAPFAIPIVEALSGIAALEITAVGIFGTAQALIKGFLKPKVTEIN